MFIDILRKISAQFSPRILVLILAISTGIIATFAAQHYLDGQVKAIQAKHQPSKTKQILVAKQDLDKGTLLTSQTTALRNIPIEWLPSQSLSAEQFQSIEGSPIQVSLKSGEPIFMSYLESEKPTTFSSRLLAGRRAMTVAVDEINSISGLLEPGDLIDFYLTVQQRQRRVTYPLLQSVKVLATGQKATPQSNLAPPNSTTSTLAPTHHFSTVTIDTSPEDAKRLIAGRQTGVLTALLRAPGDLSKATERKIDSLSLLGIKTKPLTNQKWVPVIYGGRGVISRIPALGFSNKDGPEDSIADIDFEELLNDNQALYNMPAIQSNDYSQDYSINEPASQKQPLVIPNTKPSVDILSSSAVSLSSNR